MSRGKETRYNQAGKGGKQIVFYSGLGTGPFSLEDEGPGADYLVLVFFLQAEIGIPLFSDRRVRSGGNIVTNVFLRMMIRRRAEDEAMWDAGGVVSWHAVTRFSDTGGMGMLWSMVPNV